VADSSSVSEFDLEDAIHSDQIPTGKKQHHDAIINNISFSALDSISPQVDPGKPISSGVVSPA
ncbi:uncharacterized protein METZ01_LOCUS439817, partial [marine metagenome]